MEKYDAFGHLNCPWMPSKNSPFACGLPDRSPVLLLDEPLTGLATRNPHPGRFDIRDYAPFGRQHCPESAANLLAHDRRRLRHSWDDTRQCSLPRIDSRFADDVPPSRIA